MNQFCFEFSYQYTSKHSQLYPINTFNSGQQLSFLNNYLWRIIDNIKSIKSFITITSLL